MAVNAESGQALLGMRGQHRGQIHGARTLGAVEAPHGLGGEGVHIHRFRAVAPAGGNGQGHAHVFARKLLRAIGRLLDAANGRIGDDAFHRQTAAMAQVGLQKFLGGAGQAHRLLFERFAHALAAAVDDRTDADLGQRAAQAMDGLIHGDRLGICLHTKITSLKTYC